MISCLHSDTCLPDYWSGHHKAHVCVPVYRGMTSGALRDAIISELMEGAVCGSDELATSLYEARKSDKLTASCVAAVRRDVKAKGSNGRLFLHLDKNDDDESTVYAYFIFDGYEG